MASTTTASSVKSTAKKRSRASNSVADSAVPRKRTRAVSRAEKKNRRTIGFLNVPRELRDKIWDLAAQDIDPRVVTIDGYFYEFETGGEEASKCNESLGQARMRAICDVPVLLRTCKESREAALKYYQLSFKGGLHGAQVYFNFQKDTLFLVNCEALRFLYGSLHQLTYREHVDDLREEGQKGPNPSCKCVKPDVTSTIEALQNKLHFLIIGTHPSSYKHDDAITELAKFVALEELNFPMIGHPWQIAVDLEMKKVLRNAFIKQRGKGALLPKIEALVPKVIKMETNYPRRANAKKRGANPLNE